LLSHQVKWMTRLFRLSSLTTTIGVAAVACQLAPPDSSGPLTTVDGGRPVVDAGRTVPSEPFEDPCDKSKPFVPPVIALPVAQRIACDETQLEALAKACSKEPESAKCTAARALAENAACADCIFGAKTDERWKMIILQPGETPAARYNQPGCIDLASGIAGCGASYFTVVSCFDHFCAECTGADETVCQKDVAQGSGECKPFLIDEACGDALDAAEKTCFPGEQTDVAIEVLFKNMGRTFCQSAPPRIEDAGSD